mgnify:FL=1|tara:strand:+ start:840 stop:1217 length:378 start_codon:yes stop_codon:yes gene_type:complete
MAYWFNNKEYSSQIEYRKALRESDNRCNSYEPWTDKEDKELRDLSKTMSIPELANHFKRIEGGIIARIFKITVDENKNESKSDIFLDAILNGANPITGEILEEDSVWKHPKIINDIQQFLTDKSK